MNLRSAARAISYLARDIAPALRRMTAPPYDDDPDAYAEHLAQLHAAALAEREAQTEVLEPQDDCGLGEADECLCRDDVCLCEEDASASAGSVQWTDSPSAADEPAFAAWCAYIDARLAAVRDQLTSAAPGDILPPDAAPERPAPPVPEAGAGHPGFPDWCAAEMRQVADILLTTDSPVALGYANDLRSAAGEYHQK